MLVVGVAAAAVTSSADRIDTAKAYVQDFQVQQVPRDLAWLAQGVAERGKAFVNDVVLGQQSDPRQLPLSMFIDKQERTCWYRLLENIHPPETDPGCIVASPSRFEPNYWFQWTRDSALVMHTLVDQFKKSGHFRSEIDDYVNESQKLQHLDTVIGNYHTGGLGDVKYNVDGTAFTDAWCRPQPDGPALRAITLISFARQLLKSGTDQDKNFVKSVLYDSKLPTESVIKADLEYVSHHWTAPGCDLWEEVRGQHFYTQMSVHRALHDGASLAMALGDHGAAVYYAAEAAKVSKTIDEFWSEESGRIRVTVNHTQGNANEANPDQLSDTTYGKKSELDTAVLLAVLHSGKGTTWELDSRVFATLDKIIKVFLPLYPINQGRTVPALGRYDSDQYDGIGLSEGHPWYLCTLSAAELLYRSSRALSRLRTNFTIEPRARDWYSRFIHVPFNEHVQLVPGSTDLRKIVRGQRRMADQFVQVVQDFVRVNGSMNEQFHRTTGEGRGARDLTWSYAAFITAAQARKGLA
ncbi:hypothetical protein OIV83_003216 [Microbotryomycetes sp. JL201]|nr:hypothetical protein OIV83_003216 [Microbotryomycetes sp. JL201]